MYMFINLLSNIKQKHDGSEFFWRGGGGLISIAKETFEMGAKYHIEVRI